MNRIAQQFIDPVSTNVLPQLKTTLENIRSAKSEAVAPWGITKNYPLKTIESYGEYEPGDHGEHVVYAELTSKWEIMCPHEEGPKSKSQSRFSLVGTASTKVCLFEFDGEDDPVELAAWRMEIGDDAAPGCHFHVQVLGEEHHTLFPHSLSVPRFPGIVVTPVAVLEFVLAELFQDAWKQHAARETPEMQLWKPIQQRRISSIIDWQSKCVRDSIGSPWTSFKIKKPQSVLFIPHQ